MSSRPDSPFGRRSGGSPLRCSPRRGRCRRSASSRHCGASCSWPARAGFDDLAAHDDPGKGGHRQLLSGIAVLSRIFGARRFADLQRQTRPAITPPSTSWIAPVVQLALSDKRNTMWLARSSGRPTRPIGWNPLKPSVRVCSTLSGSMNALRAVSPSQQALRHLPGSRDRRAPSRDSW